ncbi:MAG: hypothetical protein NC114_06710 [Ruminococcus flavefaciens]|nr:hypothetical protein [Ruminococcus flavefaciens]
MGNSNIFPITRTPTASIQDIIAFKQDLEKYASSGYSLEVTRFMQTLVTICRDSENAERFTRTLGYNDDEFSRIYANASKYGFKRCVDLWNKYHRTVVEKKQKGQYDYWAAVSRLDMIDASDIHDQLYSVTNPDALPDITRSIQEYSHRVGFYSALPCFHLGVLKITHGVKAVWSVSKIDELGKYFVIDVLTYYDGAELNIGENVISANFRIGVCYNPTDDPIRTSIYA